MPADSPHESRPVQHRLFEDDEHTTRSSETDYAVMFSDGACSGNPGPSGIGVVIKPADSSFEVKEEPPVTISEHIGTATNNIAEYTALLTGLRKCRDLGIRHLRVFVDSELLVRQLQGVYKVKNRNLIPLWSQAVKLLKDFQSAEVRHVRRELNAEADALARNGSRSRR